MDLNTLIPRLESTLLQNDERLDQIEIERDKLNKITQQEEEKISTTCSEVNARVSAAGEILRSKMRTEMNKLDKELFSMREAIVKDSLVLCSEVDKISKVATMDEGKFDMISCWKNVGLILSASKGQQHPELNEILPSFQPSKTLAKLKSYDLGYLNTAEFHPSQFQLCLTFPTSNVLEVGLHEKAVCTVVTSQMFNDMIQADIKVSVKIKDCKDPVIYCNEECKLSQDKKTFQIVFKVTKPGNYVVTVLLYDQHVADSPLVILAGESHNKVRIIGDEQQLSEIIPATIEDTEIKQMITPTASHSPSSMPVLPPGPLNLAHLAPGSMLVGVRMLSINVGLKDDCVWKAIGMCLLHNGNIVVASTGEQKVKIFTPEGKFVKQVCSPEKPFDRPTDMVTLQSGQFVVRDSTRVQVFSDNGEFVKNMWQDRGKDMCYGLAQDKEGRLITIMESRRPRTTNLLFFDLGTGELVKKIEMEDIITNKAMSKCRFLTYQLGKLFITDLGLDCVYILDPRTNNAKVFGCSGSGPGELSDPAGLVVDSVGTMIVADSRNHRLCVFNREGKFVCPVRLKPDTKRPSGVALDIEKKELYVLNLHGKFGMTKYKLG